MASNSRGGEGTTNAVVRGTGAVLRRLPPSLLAAPSVASELSVPPIGRRPGEACCSITPQVGGRAARDPCMDIGQADAFPNYVVRNLKNIGN